jgi:toxin ParE1/3/4
MKLHLYARAKRDLDEAFAYIELDDPASAKKVAQLLVKSVRLLAENPLIGRPSLNKNVREWSVPGLPYVIPYRVKGQTVQIIRIFHTSRNRPTNWSKR